MSEFRDTDCRSAGCLFSLLARSRRPLARETSVNMSAWVDSRLPEGTASIRRCTELVTKQCYEDRHARSCGLRGDGNWQGSLAFLTLPPLRKLLNLADLVVALVSHVEVGAVRRDAAGPVGDTWRALEGYFV